MYSARSFVRSEVSRQALYRPDVRAAELRGSMFIEQSRQHLVEGSLVLLLDDVVTHGTPLNEARTVLLEAGAAEVICLCTHLVTQ